MRVLHLTTELQGLSGRVVIDLAIDQRRRGQDVMVVASSTGTAGFSNSRTYLDALGRNNVPVQLVDSMSARDYASNLCALGAIDALFPAGREPNVIHTHAAIPSLVALLYAGVRRRPMTVLQTMHGADLGEMPDQAATDVALLNRVDRVVVPSRHTRELLVSLGVLPERLAVVPYGVDDRQPELEPADEAVMLGMIRARRRGALVLACAGTPGTDTNQPLLVEALARLSGRLPVYCVFLDNGSAARRLAAGADALVLSSQGDRPPIAVLEAFCDGTMVVVSDAPDRLELVTDGETGLTFTSDDPDDLAAALLRLSTLSNQARREIRTRARSLYTERFSTTVMAEQYLSLYQRLNHSTMRTRPKKRVA